MSKIGKAAISLILCALFFVGEPLSLGNDFFSFFYIPSQAAALSLESFSAVSEGHYTGNEGDSRVFNLTTDGLVGNDGRYHRNGNTGLNGEKFYNGFEIWIARWNYSREISFAWAEFDIQSSFNKLYGKTSLIKSYNINSFDSTLRFYGDGHLLSEYRLTPTDYIKDIEINVKGVKKLKIEVADNTAAAGGTSFALYDLFFDSSNSNGLTVDQIINIYLNYSSVWAQNGQEKYFFLDLDFDGVLELVSSLYMGRTGNRLYFFRIDPSNEKVVRMATNGFDGTYCKGMKTIPELCYNNGTNQKEYRSVEETWTNKSSYTIYRKYTSEKEIVNEAVLYYEKQTSVDGSTSVSYEYYIEENEVSKTAYLDYVQQDKANCRDLNLKTDLISGEAFNSASNVNKRNMLLTAYQSFSYDGYSSDINNTTAVFYEKSYIADIWLNLRDGIEATGESEIITDILNYSSLSTGVYNSLNSSKQFKIALGLWKGFGSVFDSASTTKDYTFGMTELYEAIIFDLLENALEQDNTQNLIIDSIDVLGKGSKCISKAKSFVDNLLGTIGTGAENLYDLNMIAPGSAGIDLEKVLRLADMQEACKKYTDNQVLKYLGDFLTAAKSLADFFQMVVSFQMAVNMSIEMESILSVMRANTSDTYLQIALNNVISAVDNANWASFVITTRFAEDTSINISKKLMDYAWKSNPYTATLKLGYDVGKTVSNILSNTDGIIDAYYECMAMTSFVEANKKAIASLATTYKTKKDEHSASAYVYAMRMYENVYLLDFDATLNLVKKSTEEGLINRVDNFSKSLADWIFHTEHESTYDSLLKNKDSLSAVLQSNFDFLLNAWKFNENYLKKDYPSIYPIYVANEISQDIYTPKILSAYINNNGDSIITYSFDCCYTDKETGKNRFLYGTDSFNGVEALEQIGDKKNTKTNNGIFSSSIAFSNYSLLSTFPKTYKVRAYADTEKGKVYTQYSQSKLIENPCKSPTLVTIRGLLGVWVGIYDDTPTMYKNKQYKVFRKTNTSDYQEIGTILRGFDLGGFVTIIPDVFALKGNTYTYKVIAEITFNNGTVIQSPESNEFTLKTTTNSDEIQVNYTDNRIKNSTTKKAPSLSKRDDTSDGISITWNSVKTASGYEIYRKPNFGTNYTLLKAVDKNTNSFIDLAIEDCVEYDYLIVPYQNGTGNQKVYSTNSYGEVSTKQTYLSGDVNGDGKITSSDVTLLDQYFAVYDFATHTSTVTVTTGADANGDGEITSLDITLLDQYFAAYDYSTQKSSVVLGKR